MLIQPDLHEKKCPTPAQYDTAIEKWKTYKAKPRTVQEKFYREKVFPLSCLRILHDRRMVPRRRLLFVPVGMQPYAPLLAILGNPAETVALLYSPESQIFAEEIEREFGGLGDTHFLFLPISPVDVTDIALAMKSAYVRQGSPPGNEVAADISGGKKAMSAAVAGVGAHFGWDVFYVEGIQERELLGFSHHERILPIANVLEAFGFRERGRILDLIAAGATHAAVTQLNQFMEDNLVSASDRAVQSLVYCAHAVRNGEYLTFGKYANLLCAQTPEWTVSAKTRKYMKKLEKAKMPGPETADFITLGSKIREGEGLPGESRRLMELAVPHLLEAQAQMPGSGEKARGTRLKAGMKTTEPHWYPTEITEIDELFGSGISGTVERFR